MNRVVCGNGNTFVTDLYTAYSIGRVGGGFLMWYFVFNNRGKNGMRIRRQFYILHSFMLTLYNNFLYFFNSFTIVFWLFITHQPHDQTDFLHLFLWFGQLVSSCTWVSYRICVWVRLQLCVHCLTLFDTIHLACFGDHSDGHGRNPMGLTGIPTGICFLHFISLLYISSSWLLYLFHVPVYMAEETQSRIMIISQIILPKAVHWSRLPHGHRNATGHNLPCLPGLGFHHQTRSRPPPSGNARTCYSFWFPLTRTLLLFMYM